jgi:flagellar hook-associated protein 3 FlgL
MRITNNMVTNSILSELQQLEGQQSSLQTEVSSGLAVTQPSDNPAAFGQVVELEGQSNESAQFGKNAQQALNLANASYAGLDSLQQIYDRASQLGALGTGTLGSSATTAYGSELDQLIQQAVQVANSQLNNTYIYAGTAVNQPPFSTTLNGNGQIGSVSYTSAPGSDQQASIALSATSSVSPSTSGTTNQGIATLINHMISLRDALNSDDSTGISTSSTDLASDEDVITSAVAENGAIQTRIQADQTQQQASANETSSLISGDTNADLSTTIVKLNQAQLAYQASLQTAASVMHISILNYINLQ